MKRVVLLTILSLVLAAPASAAEQQRPVPFLKGVVSEIVGNDYETAWLSLHPAHQAVASEDEYMACEALSPVAGRLKSLVAVRTRRRLIAVAGSEQPVRGVVVTFRLHLVDPSSGASVAFTLNAATVQVAQRWVWMLPSARYELYKSGACSAL
jgi:hypothetical protein